MKKLSLMIAALVFSAASFAQDARKAQEPVKAAPAAKEVKGEKVPVAGSKSTSPAAVATPAPATPVRTSVPAPAKRKLVRKTVVQTGKMQPAPAAASKAK
jgi:hypothetical protein